MTNYTCPVCGKDRDEKFPAPDVIALMRQRVVVSEYMNPGGRRFGFQDGLQVQVSDCCSACDNDTLRKALTASPESDKVGV